MNFRSFLLLVLVCILWALNMVVSHFAVGPLHIPPIWFTVLRSGLVSAIMLPWLFPFPEKPLKVALVTFAVSGGSFALQFIGLKHAAVSAASVVGLSSAPLTALFAVIFLGEVIHWRRAAGIFLAFAGVVVAIASPEDMNASVGLLFIFASAIVSALGAVFLKRLELNALRLQAWAGVSSACCLLPLSLVLEHGQIAATGVGGWPLIASVAFSAIGVSIVAHTLYFRLLQTHDANLVGPLTLMTPVFAVIAGVAINGDHVGPPLFIGGAIALIGVIVILVRPSTNLFKPFVVRTRI